MAPQDLIKEYAFFAHFFLFELLQILQQLPSLYIDAQNREILANYFKIVGVIKIYPYWSRHTSADSALMK